MTTDPAPIHSARMAATHGFFTRQGGASGGPYASLNCSLSGGDARDMVLANRARAVQAIGGEPAKLVGLMQVHGVDVVHVTAAWEPGAGLRADAMVTDRPGICLGIITADCAPVLLADSETGVIGAAHAGWRGAVGGVIEATIAAMVGLGARRPAITAAIGPCIHQDSYEVGADLRAGVITHNSADIRFFATGRREARWQFDLPGYCAARLDAAGIHFVDTIDADTAADEERFFSYRRRTLGGGGPIGHQISIIALNPR